MMLYGIKKLIIQSVLLKVTLLDHKVLGLFLSGHETILSKRIWTLKDNNKPSIIKWRIIKQCRFCNNIRKKYNLRLFEKFVIIYRKNIWSLKLWWCKRVLSGDMLIVAVVVFFFRFYFLRVVICWWTETRIWQEEAGSPVQQDHQSNWRLVGEEKWIAWITCSVAQVINI